jgi:hypothetical protein
MARGLAWLAGVFTIPGVVIHEWTHAVACRLCGVRITEVCYFQLGSPPGYVRHERPDRLSQQLLVSLAPLLGSLLLGTAALLAVAVSVRTDSVSLSGLLAWPPATRVVLLVVAGWLGVAAAYRGLPSEVDADAIWTATKRGLWHPLAILSVPLVVPLVLALYALRWLGWPARVGYVAVVASIAWLGSDWLLAAGVLGL